MSEVVWLASKLLRNFFVIPIPSQYKGDFELETERANLQRAESIAKFLILIELGLIIRTILVHNVHALQTPRAYYLAMYLVMVLAMLVFLRVISKAKASSAIQFMFWVGYTYALFVLSWCAGLSFLDQWKYQQITVYVGAIFALSVGAQIKPKVILSLFILVHIPFVIALSTGAPNPRTVPGHIINSTILVVIALGISRTVYSWRVKEFCNRQTIQRQCQELVQVNNKLEELSNKDCLTGVLNRSAFEKRTARIWRIGQTSGVAVGVMMIDIDRFKEFNDGFGHQAGDECVQKVAEALQRVAHEGVVVGRYGGDEFIVAALCLGNDCAGILGERIHDQVQNIQSPKISVSVGGYSAVPQETDTLESFIRKADENLYSVKLKGRNGVLVQQR